MYTGLLHAHSGLRWIVLVLIVWALFKAISGWSGQKEYQKSDRLSALLALIFTHIQLLIGLVSFAVGMIFPEPPEEVQEMVESIRYPQ